MKTIYLFVLALFASVSSFSQTTHNVQVFSFGYEPEELAIAPGDIVVWENTGGNHNVNATTATFPDNPESFGNTVAPAPWTFEHTFNTEGTYNYQCDPHASLMQGTIIVTEPLSTEELSLAGIKAYPSPAIDYFVLYGTADFSGDNTLQVFDITGKMVLQQIVQSGKEQISVQDLNPGVYILNLTTEMNQTYTGKLMVQ